GKWLRAPTKVGPLGKDAEARARRVDEGAVEAVELRRQRRCVGLDHRDVGAAHRGEVLAQFACASRVDLDGRDLAAQLPGLAARRGTEVEHSLAVARTETEPGEL